MYSKLDYNILALIKEAVIHLEKNENMMINHLVYYHTLESIPLKIFALEESFSTIKRLEEIENGIMDIWRR